MRRSMMRLKILSQKCHAQDKRNTRFVRILQFASRQSHINISRQCSSYRSPINNFLYRFFIHIARLALRSGTFGFRSQVAMRIQSSDVFFFFNAERVFSRPIIGAFARAPSEMAPACTLKAAHVVQHRGSIPRIRVRRDFNTRPSARHNAARRTRLSSRSPLPRRAAPTIYPLRLPTVASRHFFTTGACPPPLDPRQNRQFAIRRGSDGAKRAQLLEALIRPALQSYLQDRADRT